MIPSNSRWFYSRYVVNAVLFGPRVRSRWSLVHLAISEVEPRAACGFIISEDLTQSAQVIWVDGGWLNAHQGQEPRPCARCLKRAWA
jgi:hypothetical protein